MAILKYISVHHSGGLANDLYAPTQNLTANQVNEAHRLRWPNFISAMGKYTGYNIVILGDGSWVQTRALGEETAHTKGFNTSAIGILLMGNFTLRAGTPVEKPTKEQEETYKILAMDLLMRNYSKFVVAPNTTFELKVANIYPHRFFNQTECYGSYLDSNWARNIINELVQIKIAWIRKMIAFYQSLLDEQRKKEFGRLVLQGNDLECLGHL